MYPRSPTPQAVKRQLRQEAHFGCCKCGWPIIQYHHIVPWADETHFRVADMMALCPNHHDEATKGALSVAEQRRLKADPYNRSRGWTEGVLKASSILPVIRCGSVDLVNDGPMIVVDGEPLLSLTIENDSVLVSVHLYDEDDNLLLLIDQNEWISGDPLVWDVEADFQKLRIRTKSGDVRLALNVQRVPLKIRARLMRHGETIDLAPRGIVLSETVRDISFDELCFVGSVININTGDDSVALMPDPRYGQSCIISWPDRLVRIAMGVNKLHELQGASPLSSLRS